MATQFDETLIDDEPVAQDVADDTAGDDAPVAGDDDDGGAAAGEDDVDVVGWGDEAVDAAEEPEGMRNLRNRLREIERENKVLKTQQAPAADPVGDKPNIDDYWDKPEEFERDLLTWSERKREADEHTSKQQDAARRQNERWEAQHRDLEAGFGDLRAPGKEAARATVEDQFPAEQFAYLVKAAGKNAPGFIFALGNSEEKRAELKALAEDGSWVEFIAAAAVMAKEVNVQRRKPATAPEQNRTAAGTSGGGTGAASKTLDRLEAEAAKTGDRTQVIAYRRKLREQGKA